ncbi:bifunctional adenosylcobinamide kinase/adenosylcobinamide-phosphate guanylyltransferase [[Clostridium] aminophilum]|uniref:Adenosylcobinamide kinase n=1 Tax=[Clostridium] aminophilum TaxID=1526 RepID=A0A1I6IKW7_9FIRM|nr:bifunctional adenosylcobinamide kinase/adenosylcobinamide-phosphate guanylyltransferase [[Clostridium] aminophilum]SFR66940.1 adenosylcobinamide kinase /adenosylcobinamide-phosphate guanylyltransferase [[Clostridium] aminophilum]
MRYGGGRKTAAGNVGEAVGNHRSKGRKMILIVGGRSQGKSKIARSYASETEILLHLEDKVAALYGLQREMEHGFSGNSPDRTSEVSRIPSPDFGEAGKTDVSADADKTDVSAEAGKTDVSADADKTDVSAEAGKSDASAETGKTGVSAEGGKQGISQMAASQESSEEIFWKKLREATEETVQRILADPRVRVITADEIGCGVVPMSRREREYRDTYGRICQKIAKQADTVIRVVCGIPTVISSDSGET